MRLNPPRIRQSALQGLVLQDRRDPQLVLDFLAEGRIGVVARVAIAARDTCWALIVLATLADGPATSAELRRAAGFPGDSFRSLLRRMARAGLIEREAHRWRRVSKMQICVLGDERLAA